MSPPNSDTWMALHRSLSPWDINVLTLTRFSHICKASREVFTSDTVWDPLNVYNVFNIFDHFYGTVDTLCQEDQRQMRLVWELAQTNSDQETISRLIAQIQNGLRLEYKNLYKDLGFIIATAFLPLRRDVDIRYTVSNQQLMLCALQINPLCIKRLDPSLFDAAILYKVAYHTALNSCDLGDLDYSAIIADFFAHIFRLLPDHIRYCKSIIKSMLRRDPHALALLPTRFQHNVALVLYALSFHGVDFADLPREMQKDKEFLVQAIMLQKQMVKTLPVQLLQDRDFILAAFATPYTTDVNCEEIVDAIARAWLEHGLNDDLEVMSALVNWCGLAIRLAGTSLKEDSKLRETALCQNGLASQYFDCTRSEALTAVKSEGRALEFLQPWQDDPEVVNEAIKNNAQSQQFSLLPTPLSPPKSPVPVAVSVNPLVGASDFPLRRGRQIIRIVA